jgi:glycerophosphoryl diester phosphodiesterase
MRLAGFPVCLLALLALSCAQDEDILVPDDPGFGLPAGLQPIPPATRRTLQGVYVVSEGSTSFGDFSVLRWSYVANGPDTVHYLSMFCGREAAYFILEGGCTDSTLHFSGYWRKMTGTGTGDASFVIGEGTGGRRLLAATPTAGPDSIVMIGRWKAGTGNPEERLVLRYHRPLIVTTPFAIIAHRAGGRNSDLLPASENTVAMTLLAERFGATGIEIDVRLTSDNVPILYHDANLNLRLNEKNGLVGPVESYTYIQLQTFVRLIHGETIPTLAEVLEAVITRTNLRIVWIDMKSERPSMGPVRTIQKAAMAIANAQAAAGRRNPLTIFIGLPTEEKADEFVSLPDYRDAPALCELSIDQVRRTDAVIWAPRWTLGTQPDAVAQMHAENRKVFVWTLDVAQYIQQYIQEGTIDGILSNYPSLVAFQYFMRPPQP